MDARSGFHGTECEPNMEDSITKWESFIGFREHLQETIVNHENKTQYDVLVSELPGSDRPRLGYKAGRHQLPKGKSVQCSSNEMLRLWGASQMSKCWCWIRYRLDLSMFFIILTTFDHWNESPHLLNALMRKLMSFDTHQKVHPCISQDMISNLMCVCLKIGYPGTPFPWFTTMFPRQMVKTWEYYKDI